MRKRNLQSKGFTLIEIAVVVLVIAILAAVALPQYKKSLERSRAAEAFDILTEIRNKQEARELLGTGTAKGYTVKFSDLGEVIEGKTSTTNTLDTDLFTYTLSNNPYPQAYAKRKDMDYSIVQANGYQDSALCCLGKDCKVVDSVLKGCEKTACPTTCATGHKRTGYFFQEDGPCCEAKTACSATCLAGEERTAVQYIEDGACCQTKTCGAGQTLVGGICKTTCPATCSAGEERTAAQYSEDGACCQTKTCGAGQTLVGDICKTTCPATCSVGEERTAAQYSEDGPCCETKCDFNQIIVNGVCKTPCASLSIPQGYKKTSNNYLEEEGGCYTKDNSCRALPKYFCGGNKHGGYCVHGGYWSGGTEYLTAAPDYIVGYECKNSVTGEACDGCVLPLENKCSDSGFFEKNMNFCCNSSLGDQPKCCINVISSSWPTECEPQNLPQGQHCSMDKMVMVCKNLLGNACVCASKGGALPAAPSDYCNKGQVYDDGVCKTICPNFCPSGKVRSGLYFKEEGACCVDGDGEDDSSDSIVLPGGGGSLGDVEIITKF
ncbi:Type II secretion system subunit [Elusimicrobium minutum Pei191]|uniref:Type II secretion system subunit n=1 Tax=Elusimicrobium minutum (strain Pei191) TaxID=445932 RepID=B2KCK1_ELUMP|nr:prepilin-type N-terminal cleavage/methylation domain-containing protein [Elusimicrobium minutum]ACC98247.1 Type II secretion system subunit [Elusimicrobium minutum Pei191]